MHYSSLSTTNGSDLLLGKKKEKRLKQLKYFGKIILTSNKTKSIINCGSIYPKIKSNFYSEESTKKSCVETCFNEVDLCPRIYSVVERKQYAIII